MNHKATPAQIQAMRNMIESGADELMRDKAAETILIAWAAEPDKEKRDMLWHQHKALDGMHTQIRRIATSG